MTTASIPAAPLTHPAADMPEIILTDAGCWWKTEYTGELLRPGAVRLGVPVGSCVYEYWLKGHGDARRLYAVTPKLFWVE